jgi:hypothetical protein
MDQVGGDHYKGQFQHWDWVNEVGLGYLDGTCTKYIARWRKKNGREDLNKAMHYLEKLLSVTPACVPVRTPPTNAAATTRHFVSEHGYCGLERDLLFAFAQWRGLGDLQVISVMLQRLLNPVLVPDPEPVPLCEENHYAERVSKVIFGG